MAMIRFLLRCGIKIGVSAKKGECSRNKIGNEKKITKDRKRLRLLKYIKKLRVLCLPGGTA